MVKPRLILLIRHAQSEGNKDRAIHQMIPDHRVKLTDEGHKQAEEAGHRLRRLLKPDDTLQIFTSPYRRTRETTEGILQTLTSPPDPSDPNVSPSPFSRSKIKVYEEPRLREQDFGNFQPCSAEMERMWQERADYGHFFYRIPNGESAADAYDRISGFNESLWRQFGEKDFPSVCVLVTHGLMTRVFLMKWYHWSVEYFEDLRNVNHCEFVVMQQNQESGKFVLENQLRTWSELKRQRAEEARMNPSRRNTLSAFLQQPVHQREKSPSITGRRWGGCADGCDHHEHQHDRQQNQSLQLPPAAESDHRNEAEDHAFAAQIPVPSPTTTSTDGTAETNPPPPSHKHPPHSSLPSLIRAPGSGTNTPHEMPSSPSHDHGSSYFPPPPPPTSNATTLAPRSMAGAVRQIPQRKPTPEDIERWANESGMGAGRRADALGDEPDPDGGGEDDEEVGVKGDVY